MTEKLYFVYIMTNQDNTVMYTGVTNDLQRRVLEHRSGEGGSFSNKYKL
jgi:putative endonuclease